MEKNNIIESLKTKYFSPKELEKITPIFNGEIWNLVAEYQSLSPKFISTFIDEIPIDILVKSQRVHESTIEKNIDKFKDHMFNVCKHQYLSEKFIVKNKNHVHWINVFKYQNHLSLKFIKKYFSLFVGGKKYIKDINPFVYFNEYYCHTHYYKIIQILYLHNDKITRLSKTKFSK